MSSEQMKAVACHHPEHQDEAELMTLEGEERENTRHAIPKLGMAAYG
jgi:hypothetical protein